MKNEKKRFITRPLGMIHDGKNQTLVSVDRQYMPALKHLELFSHVILMYHKTLNGDCSHFSEFPDEIKNPATEYSHQGLLIQIGRILWIDDKTGVMGLDCPCAIGRGILLDIKPYFPCEDRIEKPTIPGSMQHWSIWRQDTGRIHEGNRDFDKSNLAATPSEEITFTPIGEMIKKDGQNLLMLDAENRGVLSSLKDYSHLKIVWWFHRFDKREFRRVTEVNPPYENAPKTGVFATRSPARPNPLALTTVRIHDIDEENGSIRISQVDAFEHSPVIALIPYIPAFDRVKEFSVPGWLQHWPEWLDDRDTQTSIQQIVLNTPAVEQLQEYMTGEMSDRVNSPDLFQKKSQNDNACLDKIILRGCRQNNLQNIDVDIPKNRMTVISGVSGSGKSSLAFDTIYAESRRRFVDSMAGSGAAGFGQMEKPDFDEISGLPPAVAIEQKYWGRNPRSTVGTLTDLHDYLRLLFTSIGTRHCPECGNAITPMKESEIISLLLSFKEGTSFRLAPLDGNEGEEYFETPALQQNERTAYEKRVEQTVESQLKQGNGAMLLTIADSDEILLQTKEMCFHCKRIFFKLSASVFSFNNPESMCPVCKGLGVKLDIDEELIVANPERSILDGASKFWGDLRKFRQKPNANWMKGEILALALEMNVDLELPWQDLPAEFRHQAMYGSEGRIVHFHYENKNGRKGEISRPVEGVYNIIKRLLRDQNGNTATRLTDEFMREKPCPACQGERLAPEGRMVTICGTRFPQVANMTLVELKNWVEKLPENLTSQEINIALPILQQLHSRLVNFIDAGVSYLTLDRPIPTLSGGELQRLRLAAQLGSGITNILYVLDEPSTGLHPRDHQKLIGVLERIKSAGNTVLVVEHDADTMLAADNIIDIGPGAGIHGGRIIAQGSPEEIMQNTASQTGKFLRNQTAPAKSFNRKTPREFLTLFGAHCHNLKYIDVSFPLGTLCCVTGVSGSGKSSLVSRTLYPALATSLGLACDAPGKHERLEGAEKISNIINVTQQPIGRTPRSNPATYTGVFDLIRNLYANTTEAKSRGYKQNHFSFNSKEGQCPTCSGDGRIRHDMVFMPDIWLECTTCHGKRFNKDTLEILWQGKTIADILEMNIEEATNFFQGEEKIMAILQTLVDVGLGYIQLGQSAVTLSGGEAQRIKLAKELSKLNGGSTLYLLDEPTTGLHASDIDNLLKILHRITDSGNSVIVIEHNPEIMLQSDWIIDIGPEGGDAGGTIVAQGTPEEVSQVPESHTGRLLQTRLV